METITLKGCKYKKIRIKLGTLVTYLKDIPEIGFVNVSSNSKSIEFDTNILRDNYLEYIPQIAKNLNLTESETRDLIIQEGRRPEESPIFRVSLPLWRDHKGCYCGEIFFNRQQLYSGLLITDRYFGRFPITLLREHQLIYDEILNNLYDILTKLDMPDWKFQRSCPAITKRVGNLGHFCSICYKNKQRAEVVKQIHENQKKEDL